MKPSFLLLSLLALAIGSPLSPPRTPQCVALAGDPCDNPDGGPLQCCGGYQCQLVRIIAPAELVQSPRRAYFVRVVETGYVGLCGRAVGKRSFFGGG